MRMICRGKRKETRKIYEMLPGKKITNIYKTSVCE